MALANGNRTKRALRGKNDEMTVSVTAQKQTSDFIDEPSRLLVIQPLVGIGDMIWHKPWIDALIARHDVVLATKPASQPHILFSDSLTSDNILPIMRKVRGKKGRHDGLFGLWRLSRDIRKTGAKRALILHHSSFYHLAVKLAGITDVAAFGFGAQKGLSSHSLDAQDKKIHAIARMEKFWRINHWPAPQGGWQIGVPSAVYEAVRTDRALADLAPHNLIILGIGAMHKDRCWPALRFAELIIRLGHERPDLPLAIMGGPAERAIADEIQAHLVARGATPVTEIFTSLEKAIAILSRAKGYVGNDTSLLNIAAVQNVPSLGLFSQSPPLDYVSTLFHLNVIKEEEYGTPGIIHRIEVDDVLGGISDIWPRT